MDDLWMIRFALDNVRPQSLGECARAAFDRVLNGEAVADADSRDGRRYDRLRGHRMAGRLNDTTGTRVMSQGPPRLQLADDPVVLENGSLDGASLMLMQKEAAASVWTRTSPPHGAPRGPSNEDESSAQTRLDRSEGG